MLLSMDYSHPMSHPEQLKIGVEYNFIKAFFLRGGYVSGNSQDDFSFGVGFSGLKTLVWKLIIPIPPLNGSTMFKDLQ